MNKGDFISALLRRGQSVFSSKEIALLWGDTADTAFRKRLSSYVKSKKLHAIRKGIYAKDKQYDRFELATKIHSPSYVGFETVLAMHGIIFQKHDRIFVASYQTREIKCDGNIFSFKKIKDQILMNPLGIIQENNYSIASLERAFLDTLYLNKNYHFDNLSALDQKKVEELLKIYENKRMGKTVEKLFKNFNETK